MTTNSLIGNRFIKIILKFTKLIDFCFQLKYLLNIQFPYHSLLTYIFKLKTVID